MMLPNPSTHTKFPRRKEPKEKPLRKKDMRYTPVIAVFILSILSLCVAGDASEPEFEPLCSHFAGASSVNFERIKNHLTGAKQRYEANVEEHGGCEALGIGEGGGFGNLIAELTRIIDQNVGGELKSQVSQPKNTSPSIKHDEASTVTVVESEPQYNSLARLGQAIDSTIATLKRYASSEYEGTPPRRGETPSEAIVSHNCASSLRSYAKELFIWRNLLYSFGVAVTNPIEQCTRGLSDVPLFKEARGRRNPLPQINAIVEHCAAVLRAGGCESRTFGPTTITRNRHQNQQKPHEQTNVEVPLGDL